MTANVGASAFSLHPLPRDGSRFKIVSGMSAFFQLFRQDDASARGSQLYPKIQTTGWFEMNTFVCSIQPSYQKRESFTRMWRAVGLDFRGRRH